MSLRAILGTVALAAVLPSVASGAGASHISFASATYATGGAWNLAADDFNGDGRLDLAVTDGASAFSVLVGDAHGGFSLVDRFPAVYNALGIANGDFNRDGRVDLALTNYDPGTVSIYLGDGTGRFSLFVSFASGVEGPRQGQPRRGDGPYSIKAGDLNNDGRVDLVVANLLSGTVNLFVGNGSGTFFAPRPQGYTAFSAADLALADVNGDGNLDVAVATDSFYVHIFYGTGDGRLGFTDTNNLSSGQGCCYRTVALADLNGDAKIDVAAAGRQDERRSTNVFYNLGHKRFSHALIYPAPFFSAIALADLNQDRRLDLVGVLFGVTVMLGRQDGSFGPPTEFPGEGAGSVDSVVTGDFNRDGRIDIAYANARAAGVTVLLNTSH